MSLEQMVLRVDAAESATQQLVAHLHSMLNDPHFSDMCFLCDDGVKVHASRALLMARSPVFDRMLSNGMAESRSSEIALPEISSSTLLPTLEFLYTGAITTHAMDLETSLLVLRAASFFRMPTLEALLKSALVSINTDISISPDNACALSDSNSPEILAQLLTSILSCGVSDTLKNVVLRILACLRNNFCTGAHPTALLRHLSAEAMQMLLNFTKPWCLFPNTSSFMEYIRLRGLLLWGACHVSPSAEALLVSALPNEDLLAPCFHVLESSHKPFLEVGLQKAGLNRRERKHVERVLLFLSKLSMPDIQLIGLNSIHPVILLSVVKPVMDAIKPPSGPGLHTQLEKAFHQVPHVGEKSAMKWIMFNDRNYEVQENGTLLIAKPVYADTVMPRVCVVNTIFRMPSGVHETIFTVQELASLTFVVVFCKRAMIGMDGEGLENVALGGAMLADGNGSRVVVVGKDGTRNNQALDAVYLKEGDQIKVIVDMSMRCCTFCIAGHKVLTTRKLQGDIILAGGCSFSGKLRVELVGESTFL